MSYCYLSCSYDDIEDPMLRFVFVFGAVFNCNTNVLSPYPSISIRGCYAILINAPKVSATLGE
jgi:hypothetical protein